MKNRKIIVIVGLFMIIVLFLMIGVYNNNVDKKFNSIMTTSAVSVQNGSGVFDLTFLVLVVIVILLILILIKINSILKKKRN